MPAWKLIGSDGRVLTIVYGSYDKAVEKAENIPDPNIEIVPSV